MDCLAFEGIMNNNQFQFKRGELRCEIELSTHNPGYFIILEDESEKLRVDGDYYGQIILVLSVAGPREWFISWVRQYSKPV